MLWHAAAFPPSFLLLLYVWQLVTGSGAACRFLSFTFTCLNKPEARWAFRPGVNTPSTTPLALGVRTKWQAQVESVPGTIAPTGGAIGLVQEVERPLLAEVVRWFRRAVRELDESLGTFRGSLKIGDSRMSDP